MYRLHFASILLLHQFSRGRGGHECFAYSSNLLFYNERNGGACVLFFFLWNQHARQIIIQCRKKCSCAKKLTNQQKCKQIKGLNVA